MLDKETIQILICCHKPSVLPESDAFLPIHVGAALSSVSLDMQRDDALKELPCDNISNKNKNFCELTAIYWALKNIEVLYPQIKYIGLNHYRRYFSFTEKDNRKNHIAKNVKEISNYKIDKALLEKYLENGFVIVPKKARIKKSVAEHYEHAHNSEDLRELHLIIKEKFPEYIDSFNEVFQRQNYFYDCNMFVMDFQEFKKYASWLFSVLFALEEKINISNYNDYQKRIFGFLSERLFTVWIKHHNCKLKELNYFVYTENPKHWKNTFLFNLKFHLSSLKQKILFCLERESKKEKLERYWKVP